MSSTMFSATVMGHGSVRYVCLPFDPKPVFGQVRAPVKVTVKGATYRSRIVAMGGPPCIALPKDDRKRPQFDEGETLDVRLELDTEPREVTIPADLRRALRAAPPAWERWQALSFTHRREYAEAVESAKKPETRARRIANAVETVRRLPARAARGTR